MDAKELTALFLDYARARDLAEELRIKVEKATLDSAGSLNIAGVKATYYQPSYGTPDYQSAAISSMPKDYDLTPWTKVTESVSWKDVCAHLNIAPPLGEEGPARVIVK